MTRTTDAVQDLTDLVRALLNNVNEADITPTVIGDALDQAARLRSVTLEAADRDAIISRLEENYAVWIGEGKTLTSPVDHVPWLPARRAQINWLLYERYQAYLRRQGWQPAVLRRLDDLSEQLLSLLEDPQRPGPWDRRGMVVGQVQSGKTANYTALINRGLDAGYPLIIVLAGRFNDLRSQTQQRIDEGVLGYDTQTVRPGADISGHRMGVGLLPGTGHRVVNSLTTSAENGDFRRGVGGGIRPGRDPLVMVVKKQRTVLTNLLQWCETLTPMPVLVIDDEADDSSVDTRSILDENGEPDPEHEPTTINGLIRSILMAFDRRCYVAYTATPYANIFIHRNAETPAHGPDLFPRSFILSLPAPDTYVGPEVIFGMPDDQILGPGRQPLDLVRRVRDWQAWMPAGHRRDWVPPREALPETLREAIRCFVLATAARRARGQGERHASMLIHATRLKWVQAHVEEQVRDEVVELRRRIRHEPGDGNLRTELRELWEREFAPQLETPLAWEAVDDALAQAAGEIEIRLINGDARDSLQYLEHGSSGLKVIAIGGDKLSRGLTLEGLCISYYLRNASAYDTLLQMGRWFGYRPGYLDLCRIYTTPGLIEAYTHVTLASEELRQQLAEMADRGLTPEEFGLKVRTDPQQSLTITARNKMRSGTPLQLSYADSLSEQVTFVRRADAQENNRAAVERLLARRGEPDTPGRDGNLIWRDVPVEEVRTLLGGYQVPAASYKMVPRVLLSYIDQRVHDRRLTTWTVVMISNTRTDDRIVLAGHDIGATRREQIYASNERVSIRRLLSPPDEGLDLDAAGQERCRAPRMGRRGMTTAFSPTTARNLRPPEQGLLLIYAVRLDDRTAPPAGADGVTAPPGTRVDVTGAPAMPVSMGIALSFPPDRRAAPVGYLVNETYWATEFAGDGE